jgi:hypothetical protein
MEILQNNVDLFALILLSTVGLGLIIYNIILIKKGQQTLNWIETQGQITKSEIGISRNLSDGSVEAYYRANIEYEYEVHGKKYISDQVHLGDKIYLSYKYKAKKILNMFPIFHTVSVFVNPDNYAESVLIKGPGANRVVNIIIGLFLVVIGVIIKTNFELIFNFIKGLEN